MSLENLGYIGQFVAAIAVVVSLVYLGIQVKMANSVAKASAYRDAHQDLAFVFTDVIKDPDLNRIVRTGLYKKEKLNDDDQERLGMFLIQVFWALNSAFHSSWLDAGLEEFVKERIDAFINNPVVQEWWKRQRATQSEPFRSMVDERLDAITSSSAERTQN